MKKYLAGFSLHLLSDDECFLSAETRLLKIETCPKHSNHPVGNNHVKLKIDTFAWKSLFDRPTD